MLLNNRRQHPQLYQQQYPQQQQQFRPNHVPGGPLPFTGHTRSLSSGGRPAAPNGYSKNGRRPLNSPISNNNYPHQQQPGNNGDSNGGYNMQQQQGLAGRLRSESNPSYSSNPNNSVYSPGGTLDGVPSRAKSSGTAASGSSFQDRLRERDRERQGREREREEREAAARAIHEDPKHNTVASTNSMTATATAAAAKEAAAAAAATAQSTGTALWNRMRAAKDAINVAITGEERWPDSDDSDHEGESHVSRVLREYSDKKKIDELDRMPIASPLSSSSSTGSNYRNRTLRDAIRQEHGANNSSSPSPTSLASSASSSDYLVRSRRARGETGHLPSRSDSASSAPLRPIRTREIGQKPAGTLSPPASPASATLPTPTSPNTPSSASLETPRIGNRFRTSSDASLSAALGRLEGKRNQDALVAQVSHLGSTRARSPHRGNRAYREHIDVAPPPPLPTPKSDYRQQRQQPLTPPSSGSSSNTLRSSPSLPSLSSSLSSSRRNGQPVDLGAYGQRQQQQQQQTQQQQARYF
ncbi:hypothetical protein KI688_005662 [Linnemannia hyalina]|uniref:Uncharacterized protein n=1 Tax=Linnemannia hyalina TaxID=64524 RepID=A0A9P7Y1Z5_9FUNG|nr:hypothetical protein KI688_005662 [Linnemannia hyalina]